MTRKVWIHIDTGDGGALQRVCWYAGTSDQMVENAIRLHMRLARYSRFLLRDADGDLVPAASTLPHDHTFGLLVVDDVVSTTPVQRVDLASDSAASRQQPPRHKRRRVQHDQGVDAAIADSISASDAAAAFSSDTGHQQPTILARANLPTTPLRPRSIVHLVTRFLETFTCAIPNDDNISFIPSTGPYALYALYCHLFKDTAYHPKSQNAFYKMTSFQGKIDRQRVIRYYQCPASGALHHDGNANHDRGNRTNTRDSEEPAQYVVYKPEGKGPLLRKYVKIGTDIAHDELVLTASFVQGLNLNPVAVIDQYAAFLEGFQPVSKAVYQAHTRSCD